MRSEPPEIAAVVVLYQPTLEVTRRIKSYSDFVQKLYIVDNSDGPNEDLHPFVVQWPGCLVEWIVQGENKGVADALNVAAGRAISDGYGWLLLMDQDSEFDSAAMNSMTETLGSLPDPSTVGIIAANLIVQHAKDELIKGEISPLKTALTSGSLLNLEAYRSGGRFRDNFFIDQIDHEYSLRLRKSGYLILRCNKANLKHQLGNTRIHRCLGHTLNVSHHDYIRRYYITRNRFAVCKRYFFVFPSYSLSLLWFSFTDIFIVAFFEKDRKRKFISMLRGTRDFMMGKYGKYAY